MLEDYFEGKYFYNFANEIINYDLNCEWSAVERTVIDRLYYAVFLSYKKYLSQNGFVPYNTGKDHGEIRKFIKKELIFDEDSVEIAEILFDLKKYRVFASYSHLIESPYTKLGKIPLDDVFKDSQKLLSKIGIKIEIEN